MKFSSSTTLNAHLEITDMWGSGDGRLVDGRLTVATKFGYSLRFSFWDMSVTTLLGSRGIREVRLENAVLEGTATSFVSGLIIQMVAEDPEFRAYIHPQGSTPCS